MRRAYFYIYRNLTSNCFSVKHKGKVVERFTDAIYFFGAFSVNQKGRDRVLREKKKYVHAFVVCNGIRCLYSQERFGWNLREVVYNPYKNDAFVYADTGDIVQGDHLIVMDYPKVYVVVA